MHHSSSPTASLAASHALLAIFTEIETSRSTLVSAAPERRRLAFADWIDRARAAERVLGGMWAARKVVQVVDTLHRLDQACSPAHLGAVPDADCDDAALIAWLVCAFDVLDTPTLAGRCFPLRPRIAALSPGFTDRRYRRRLDLLQRELADPRAHVRSEARVVVESTSVDSLANDPRSAELRARVRGRRALFVSNRSAPELERLLAARLELVCEAVASVGSPRRRQALIQRIQRNTYDIVLVAHGFSGHVDTAQLGEACRRVGTLFCAVDKGCLGRVVEALWHSRSHPRLAARSARS